MTPKETCAACGGIIDMFTQDSTFELIPRRRYHTVCYLREHREDRAAQEALADLEQSRG